MSIKEENALSETERPLDVTLWGGQWPGGSLARSSEGSQKHGVMLVKTEDRLFQKV